MTPPTSRDDCAALDDADPLAALRDAFELPEGVIYLDGNSLGPLPRATRAKVLQAIEHEWGRGLITSWNDAGWIDLPRRIGGKIARLIGAQADEVIAVDSTSVNLFKLLAGALALRPQRRVIVSEAGNFPTDLYIAQGLASLLGAGHELRLVERERIADAIDEHTAVVMLTQVDYRSGSCLDMAAVTALAHRAGALMLWDLAHSAGALAVDLNGAQG
jgi:kynureninase